MSVEPTWSSSWDVSPFVDPSGTYIGLDWSDDDDHYISFVVFCGPYLAA